MSAIISYLLDATALSALYAILAIGFTLIFGVGRVLNFAHAAFITIGAFAAYQVSNANAWGMNVWLGVLASIVVTAIVGAIVYKTSIQHVDPQSNVGMIITMVIAFFVLFSIRAIYGTFYISVPKPIGESTQIAGYSLQNHLILIFVVSWLSIAFLFVFINYTRLGSATIALSMDTKGAKLVGIDTDRVNLYIWMIAAGLAGFAGMLLGGFIGGNWTMGIQPLVISFAIVILGGLGSVRGSVVGAHVIGFGETAMTTFINPALGGIISLFVLVTVLLIRPSGLWGHKIMEEH